MLAFQTPSRDVAPSAVLDVPFWLVETDYESYSHADWALSNALNRPAKPPDDTPPSPSGLHVDCSLQLPPHNWPSLLGLRVLPDKERIYTDDGRTVRTLMMVQQLTLLVPSHPTAVTQAGA